MSQQGYRDPAQFIIETIPDYFSISESFSPEFTEKLTPDFSMDMWAAGCIFAEFLARKPLFQGLEEVDMIAGILEVLGTYAKRSESTCPRMTGTFTEELLLCQFHQLCSKWEKSAEGLTNFYNDFWKNRYPNQKVVGMAEVKEVELAYDLFIQMLQPAKAYRIDVETALAHAFFREVEVDTLDISISCASIPTPRIRMPLQTTFHALFNRDDSAHISLSKVTEFLRTSGYALKPSSF